MFNRRVSLLLSLLAMIPAVASSAERSPGYEPTPTLYASHCPGNIGIDYAWPAYSDSTLVNKFREEIIFTLKALYGFEYDQETFPEVTVPIGPADKQRMITIPQGWIIAMAPDDATKAVAIPPMGGPFADKIALNAVLAKKNQIFGEGGHIEENLTLPCVSENKALGIATGVPYKGEWGM